MSITSELFTVINNTADENLEYSDDLYSDSGGNYDDAYQLGIAHGRIEFANELKQLLEEL